MVYNVENDSKKMFFVEPNIEMMNIGKKHCNDCKNIIYINKSAEQTELPEDSADMVLAVQSFHWFDKQKLKKEVNRILKPSGDFAIIWTNWKEDNNTFGKRIF